MSQTTMLSQPRRFSVQTSALPMKPAPPVTSTRASEKSFGFMTINKMNRYYSSESMLQSVLKSLFENCPMEFLHQFHAGVAVIPNKKFAVLSLCPAANLPEILAIPANLILDEI